MNEQLTKINTWWTALASREKQAVKIGGAVLIIFIMYQCFWSPFVKQVAALREHIHRQQKLLAWMQMVDQDIRKQEKQTQGKEASPSSIVMMDRLQKNIHQAGLAAYLTQLKQADNGSIRIHFEKVEFDKFIQLIASAIKQQNIAITQMSIAAETTPGEVNVDLLLKSR